MIKSLRNRLIIMITSALTIVLIIVLSILYISSVREMESNSFSMLDKNFFEMHEDKNLNDDRNKSDYNQNKDSRRTDGKRSEFTTFVEIDENGNYIEGSKTSDLIGENNLIQVVDIVQEKGDEIGQLSEYVLRYKVYENGFVIGFVDYAIEESFIKNQQINYGITLAGSLFVFFIVSVILANIAVSPIKRNWEKQQQFVADASHELKTPISILLANSSMLLSNKNKSEQDKHRWMVNINEETLHMKKLVEELLFLAKSDADKNEYAKVEFDLSDRITQSVLSFESVLIETDINVLTDIDENIMINGIETQIKQLINILLDNARKYSYPGTDITISLKKEKKRTMLKINNVGKVISEEEILNIFDRFYRSEKARNRDNESYGLGLAIAKEIVLIHNGDISVTSTTESGTTFYVVFDK